MTPWGRDAVCGEPVTENRKGSAETEGFLLNGNTDLQQTISVVLQLQAW